ncbi:MAG: DUF4093 domain-containing protein [Oscillospiraceae bacterium]|nr:DUF4093 domain-containing protein [Oscillospiraceae bacterium]
MDENGRNAPLRIEQAIVTEGKFDRTKLLSHFDAVIIETNGFAVFQNREIQQTIKRFAADTGIIVLTDSDPAGIRIRSFINGMVRDGKVLNAYVPAVRGKESRKSRPGAAGILGVEGTQDELIIKAVCDVASAADVPEGQEKVTPAELFEAGLSGGSGSSERRKAFLEKAGLPVTISSKQMLRYLNVHPGPDGFRRMISEFTAGEDG